MVGSSGRTPKRGRQGPAGKGKGKGKRPELTPEQERARTRAQVKVVVESFGRGEVGVALPDGSQDWADFLYLYRRGHVLVRDEDVERVVAALDGRAQQADNLVSGLTRLAVPGDGEVPDVLERLDRAVGVGVATPEHVLYVARVTGGGGCCPATEPEETRSRKPFPPVSSEADAGKGVLVSVVDTGWHPPAATDPASPWLAGVTGDPETIDPAALHHYAGHGTFIAGVVRCVAPSTEVRVEGFLPTGGAVFEADMVAQLVETIALGPDVISLSAGTTTRLNRPALSFEVFHERFLSQVKNTVLVAAAGNDDTREPFWPAAFPWAVSVGATDETGARAGFSNFGSWVDVYARGTDLVNAFPHGTYVCSEEPQEGEVRHFKGLARWSGTSFSTPVVAGLIAARMSRTGLSARHACDQLLDEARAAAVPGVGPMLDLP